MIYFVVQKFPCVSNYNPLGNKLNKVLIGSIFFTTFITFSQNISHPFYRAGKKMVMSNVCSAVTSLKTILTLIIIVL